MKGKQEQAKCKDMVIRSNVVHNGISRQDSLKYKKNCLSRISTDLEQVQGDNQRLQQLIQLQQENHH